MDFDRKFPENLKQALETVKNTKDLEEVTKALAIIKGADSSSHHKIMVAALEEEVLDFLSKGKEQTNNIPAGGHLTAAELAEESLKLGEVFTQSDYDEGLLAFHITTQVIQYISEHKVKEALDPLLQNYIAAVSRLSKEEYNDFKVLYGAIMVSMRDTAAPPLVENPLENRGFRP